MVSVFLALSAASLLAPSPAPAIPSDMDVRCYRLMAQLAEDPDPRISTAALTGAQYFLGRIDAAAPGSDLEARGGSPEPDAEALLGRCSELMGAGGRDFGELARRLARPAATI